MAAIRAAVLPVGSEAAADAMVVAVAVEPAAVAAVQPAPPGEQHPVSGCPLTTMPSHPPLSRCRARARASACEHQLFAWRIMKGLLVDWSIRSSNAHKLTKEHFETMAEVDGIGDITGEFIKRVQNEQYMNRAYRPVLHSFTNN